MWGDMLFKKQIPPHPHKKKYKMTTILEKMKKNLKKLQNLPTNQDQVYDLAKSTNLRHQGLGLEKSTKRIRFLNLFLIKLGIINFLIITYFYMQQDISFRATGWFPIPENMHWYHIFVLLIIIRMVIVFTTHQLTEYIKNFSLWTEKKKKNALRALTAINLLTLPFNLPLIGGFYAYIKGSEIISNNWCLGTFRRILNENEREKLYNETVQNFLEKIEVSKEVKDQLKNWAIENTKSIIEKYDDGSVFATEYLSEKLEIQKEFLQREEIKNSKVEDFVDQTTKDQQGLFPWIFEKTINGLNYFNPFVTDYKTCAIAWALLLGTGFIILLVSKSNFTPQSINDLTKGLKDQDIKIDTIKKDTDAILKETVNKLNNHQNTINTLLDITSVNHQTTINHFLNITSINQNLVKDMQEQISESQEKINTMLSRMANPRGEIPPYSARGLPIPQSILTEEKKNEIITNILTQDKKNEILKNIFKKYENQTLSMTTVQEMIKEIITSI